jgi:hypothetical protein
MMRPNWAKARYRQGAAHMLPKEYKHACDALMDAQKIDTGNVEIERELRQSSVSLEYAFQIKMWLRREHDH